MSDFACHSGRICWNSASAPDATIIFADVVVGTSSLDALAMAVPLRTQLVSYKVAGRVNVFLASNFPCLLSGPARRRPHAESSAARCRRCRRRASRRCPPGVWTLSAIAAKTAWLARPLPKKSPAPGSPEPRGKARETGRSHEGSSPDGPGPRLFAPARGGPLFQRPTSACSQHGAAAPGHARLLRSCCIHVMFFTSRSTDARTNAQLHPGPTHGSPTQLVS